MRATNGQRPSISGPVAVSVGAAVWGVPVGTRVLPGQDGITVYLLVPPGGAADLHVFREHVGRVVEVPLADALRMGRDSVPRRDATRSTSDAPVWRK